MSHGLEPLARTNPGGSVRRDFELSADQDALESRTGHLAQFFQRSWRPLPRCGVPGSRREPDPGRRQVALRGRRNRQASATAFAVAALAGQQVRCKMALVSLVVLARTLIACAVGTMTRSTSRRRACSWTSFITGSAPS